MRRKKFMGSETMRNKTQPGKKPKQLLKNKKLNYKSFNLNFMMVLIPVFTRDAPYIILMGKGLLERNSK